MATDRPPLGWFLTVMTVLFVLLALSDFTKALQFANNPAVGGLVIFGHKFHGVAHNLILGPLFGIVLLIYAYGIWNLRAWVLPLSIVYAFYVPVNMVLFWSLHQLPPPTSALHSDVSVPFADRFGRHRDLSRLPSRASQAEKAQLASNDGSPCSRNSRARCASLRPSVTGRPQFECASRERIREIQEEKLRRDASVSLRAQPVLSRQVQGRETQARRHQNARRSAEVPGHDQARDGARRRGESAVGNLHADRRPRPGASADG